MEVLTRIAAIAVVKALQSEQELTPPRMVRVRVDIIGAKHIAPPARIERTTQVMPIAYRLSE